ncbi:MAG TPA: hypothetical protein VFK02_05575, partial [Kofleriaceae bacterium]|nr:hypothetical protein [Kofleriaceae bacterium]
MTRLGWRLRALLARHLAIHGGWYAAEHARTQPSPDVGALLASFLAGQPAPGHDAARIEQLSQELSAEWIRRDDTHDAVLGRITALADRAALGRAGADLLAVIAGPALDRSYARFVRAVTGAPGVPAWFARDVVDPAGDDVAAVAAAWSRLAALGVMVDGAGGAAVAGEVETWLATGEAPVPPGAVLHAAGRCAVRAKLRAQLLPAAEPAIAGERAVVIGPPRMGAGWIAAAIAARGGRPVLAAGSADVALIRAALLHDAVVHVDEPGDARAAGLAPVAAVIGLPAGTSPFEAVALAEPLGAAVIEIPAPARIDRRAWWNHALGELGLRDGASAGRLAAYPLPLETVFEIAAAPGMTAGALERTVRAAATSPLDRWCRRLAPADPGEPGLPPELAPRLTTLEQHLATGAPVLIHLESNAPAAAAAALCTAANLELFELSAATLLCAPEGAPVRAAAVLA